MDNDVDQVLVERFRNGDREAFTTLMVRYQRPIYNAAFWIVRSADDARDIAQSVFLRVAERLDEFDGSHKFFSWIYRIAVNESLNLLRRNGHEEPLDDEIDLPGGSDDPESQARDAERSRYIQRALLTMSPMDRTVIVLRHFSECSYQEIARILDVDEKTVKSRLFEARRRLRELLTEYRSD
ncbi:MAG TPA: sigma-70 family RNA polymerase sigma factor [Casimicrobiaceae bacterium]